MAQFVDTADGIRLAFETAGGGDPSMVFVHGWSCDRTFFAPQFAHFARRHAVATLDLRGHGESSRPAPGPHNYDVSAFADDVRAVTAAAGLGRPIVIGHSLGAMVALEYATRTGAARAAILVDPAPLLEGPSKQFFVTHLADVATDEDGSWRTAYAGRLLRPTDTVRREDALAMGNATAPAIAAAGWRAIAEYDGKTALGQVRVPVLVIGSGGVERGLREACPGIVIGQTVGSGHFNQLEVPEQVNPMIERFLAVTDLA
jgi:pimeloyl-ACP methyl ester carboxylesterase